MRIHFDRTGGFAGMKKVTVENENGRHTVEAWDAAVRRITRINTDKSFDLSVFIRVVCVFRVQLLGRA
jgi:hypothetical protein